MYSIVTQWLMIAQRILCALLWSLDVQYSLKCWLGSALCVTVRLTLSLQSLSSGDRLASLDTLLRKASLGLFALGEGTGSRPSRTRNILFQLEQPTERSTEGPYTAAHWTRETPAYLQDIVR